MTLTASDRAPAKRKNQRTAVIDADIHPHAMPPSISSRLAEPWRTRFERFGTRVPAPPLIYPRVRNGGMRLDAWPQHGAPGSDLGMMRGQLLDEYDLDHGILIPLQSHTYGAEEPEFAQALCRALNEWIREEWLDPEPRLRGSICVPHESPELAAREIRRYANDRRFVQVLLPSGAETGLGRAKYDPLYAAAVDAGLPLAIHLGGIENHHGDGWPSFYLEQHAWYGNMMALMVTNLISEGVFERFPSLQVILVEGGISWAGPLMWAMDDAAELLRDDVPGLRRRPSEYFREHFWFTTQPIEEPDKPEHLVAALEHTGVTDRIMFASDYPHWDFDSPAIALRGLPKRLRDPIMAGNARRLYGLDGGTP
ncbi:MAG: amidohydrolase family protein [Pseudonocardiaceae bacterium]|nr:amidohydrolase family protein [Pseudonocardiaceae bacterium]